MKLKPYILCIAAVLSYQPALWADSVNQDIDSVSPEFVDPEERTEFNRLGDKAVTEGSVQVMVILKDSESNSIVTKAQGSEQALATTQDAVLSEVPLSQPDSVKRFSDMPILALSANKAELKRLRASKHVDKVVEDRMNFALSHELSLARIGANTGLSLAYTGAGQTIAILDNGIDPSHPNLAGKVVGEACFSSVNKKQKLASSCPKGRPRVIKAGAATVKCKSQDFACAHGTLLAGLAAGQSLPSSGVGVAPSANVIAVKVDSLITNKKVCGSAKPCSVFFDSDLLRGLEYVYKQRNAFNIAAVNVSIGGNASVKACKKSPLKKTVSKLSKANIAVIAASGNNGFTNKLSTPACVPGVISVGATNEVDDTVSSITNNAASLTLLAPGLDGRIVGGRPLGIGYPMPGVVTAGFELEAKGTSLSSAFVSGAWASLKSHKPNATVNEVLGALINTGGQ